MDKERIIKELEIIIEQHLVPDRDDYMDGIVDGILIAINIISDS